MENYKEVGRLKVAKVLHDFIETEALPGTGVESHHFWREFESLLSEFSARNRELLSIRKIFQNEIDRWHVERRDTPWDQDAYLEYLRSIGYIEPEPSDFEISPEKIDPEISSQPGPQLVVPVMNARFALNAANARWGSLYDALYGTDVISEANGGGRKGPYNPSRGKRVIAYSKRFLDEVAPLAGDVSHSDVSSYFIAGGQLRAQLSNGDRVLLANEELFIGFQGAKDSPSCVLLNHHNLHIEIQIDRDHPIGRDDAAGVSDIVLEAAVTTIMDAEDSVAAVDANDKVQVYRNWLGLMKGNLTEPVAKDGKVFTRRLADDRTYQTASGAQLTLPGRSLMLIRNVGHLMLNDAVLLEDGNAAPEGLLDAMITVLIAMHDLNSPRPKNSRSGSVYVVKPKMHGSAEVDFAVKTLAFVERALGLPENTVKIGIMDEERRTSVNLKACIHAARDRLAFINTGFLDRTGDEIHTLMEVGPVVRKGEIKSTKWIEAYESRNVQIGLKCGLGGKAQIGKGMWAMPDEMAAMMANKHAHPEAGANTAWVPSPTAATLHAIHYHAVDVFEVQSELAGEEQASLCALLTLPIATETDWQDDEIEQEIANNAQGILGYVVRWIDQGVGCSKVPDINDVGLMEDRATLRISSQHIANWLHHGICTKTQVTRVMMQMATKVDLQNGSDPYYEPMSTDFDRSIAFQAALALVINGREQPSGYTEPLLHAHRKSLKLARLVDA